MAKQKRRVIPISELAGSPLIESATEGTDLACALIGGAYIENALGSLLETVLMPGGAVTDGLLNSPTGILSTTGGRADMCYSLGLIDEETYKNAKQIAKIRNQFAHSHKPVDFGDAEVKQLCDGLTPPRLVDKDDKEVDAQAAKKLLGLPRQRFVMSVAGTFVTLSIVSHYNRGKIARTHSVRCVVSEDESSVVGATGTWHWNE